MHFNFCIYVLLVVIFTPIRVVGQDEQIEAYVNQSYEQYDSGKYESALKFSTRAWSLAKNGESDELMAKVLINRAIVYRGIGRYDSAKIDYYRALTKSIKSQNDRYISIVENNLGNLYMDLNQIDSALYFFFRSLRYKEKAGSVSSLISTYNNISNALRHNHQLDRAMEFALKSRSLIDEMKVPSSSQAQTYMQLGNIFFDRGSLDSAGSYYAKGILLYESAGNHSKAINGNMNLGNVYLRMKKFRKAIEMYHICKVYYQGGGTYEEEIRVLNNLGFAFQELLRFDSSKYYYHKAESIARKENYKKQLAPILENLSFIYEKSGGLTTSLAFLRERANLLKELYREETAAQIAELQTQYETEKNQKEILQQRAQIQQAEVERNNLIITLVAAFVVAGIAIAFFMHRSRVMKLVSKKNEEIHSREISKLLTDQELKAFDAMIEGQEKERKRVAEELHDRLGSTLSAAKLHVEALVPEKQAAEQHQRINQLLNTAIEDTRQISHNMLSGVLTKFGLVAALRDLRDLIESTKKLHVTFETIQFDERLETEKEINLYRIAQELISNVLRHANATKLKIRIERKGESLQLTVSDDGKGWGEGQENTGIGMKNIESRSTKIGGTWKLESQPGAGTTATVTVPV